MTAVSDVIHEMPNGRDGIPKMYVKIPQQTIEHEIANSLVSLLEGCGKKHDDFQTFDQAVLEKAFAESELNKTAINYAIRQAAFCKSRELAAFLAQILTKGKHSKKRYKAILKLFSCPDVKKMVKSLALITNFVQENFDFAVSAELVIDGAILLYNGERLEKVACIIGKADYLKETNLLKVKIVLADGQTYDDYLQLGLDKTFKRYKSKTLALGSLFISLFLSLVFVV